MLKIHLKQPINFYCEVLLGRGHIFFKNVKKNTREYELECYRETTEESSWYILFKGMQRGETRKRF